MKKKALKNITLTILQLPVAATLLLAKSIEYVLTKCLARLDNVLSSPFIDFVGGACEEKGVPGDDSVRNGAISVTTALETRKNTPKSLIACQVEQNPPHFPLQRARIGVVSKKGAAGPRGRREVDLRKFENLLDALKVCDEEEIRSFRKIIEATKTGRHVVANSSDRRLYAVLIPTREEDLKRIGKVFDVLSRIEFTAWLVVIETALGLRLV